MARVLVPAMMLVLVVTIALSVRAAPPANADPALAPWFQSLRQPGTGESCCSLADCRPAEYRQTRNGYEAWIDGRFGVSPGMWVPVPEDKILQRIDNPTGRAVACYTPVLGILCFVRPAES